VLTRSDGAARLDPGHLYRLIVRLVDEELIAEAATPAGEDREDERRKYYALTPRGRQVLRAEVARLETLLTGVRASLARRTRG
jgi:DNA-binding PadR family transcriptional regulator